MINKSDLSLFHGICYVISQTDILVFSLCMAVVNLFTLVDVSIFMYESIIC